jgi:hypothetical protein
MAPVNGSAGANIVQIIVAFFVFPGLISHVIRKSKVGLFLSQWDYYERKHHSAGG